MAMPLALPRLELIDERDVKDLIAEAALTGATIMGQPDGWVIVIHCGSVGWVIAEATNRGPRLWKNLEDASAYSGEFLELQEFRVDLAQRARDSVTRHLVDKAEQALRLRQAAGYQALRMRYPPYRDSQ